MVWFILLIVVFLLIVWGLVSALTKGRIVATGRISLPGQRSLTWHGPDNMLQVRGVVLSRPFVYAGRASKPGVTDEPSAIDVSLRTGMERLSDTVREVPHQPAYKKLSPAQRSAYLSWLAEGRETAPTDDGFLVLWLAGLERRVLIDQQDIDAICDELLRLVKLFLDAGGSTRHRFLRNARELLWLSGVMNERCMSLDRMLELADVVPWTGDEERAAALGWLASSGTPIDARLARALAQHLPGARQSVVLERAPDEFARLFDGRYAMEFGDGVVVQTTNSTRHVCYEPINTSLKAASIRCPDVGVLVHGGRFVELWNCCIDDLRSFARRMENGLTPAAWAVLPPELQRVTEHPLAAEIAALVRSASTKGGPDHLPVKLLAATCGLKERERLTSSQSRMLATTLEDTGWGIEPDARLTRRSYRWDQHVAILPGEVSTPDPVRYNAAAALLRLGLRVATADGTGESDETLLVTRHLEEAFGLSEAERRRLEALQSLLLKEPVRISGVARAIRENLSSEQCRRVGQVLTAVACADGAVTEGERTALRSCFKALGLGRSALDESLEALEKQPSAKREVARLDRSRIASILEETREVAALLADAMNADEEDPVEEATEPAAIEAEGLPARYRGFWDRLLRADDWSLEAAEALAREFDLMLAGALEEINDWAFEQFGGPVVHEQDDRLEIDREMIRTT